MRNSETLIGKVHHCSSLAGQPSLQEKKYLQASSSRGGGSGGAVSVQAISMWCRISSFLEEGSSSVMLTNWSCSQICTCHWFFGRSEVWVIFPWNFIASEVTVYLKSHSVNLSHRPLTHWALEPQALEPQSPQATGLSATVLWATGPWATGPWTTKPLSHKALEPQSLCPDAIPNIAKGTTDPRVELSLPKSLV